MKNTKNPHIVKNTEILKGLKSVDDLFDELENDNSLPGFGEFVLTCLIMGNAECVNLKQLYPKFCKRLTAWLENHNKQIIDTNDSMVQ
jgi:hypothetical protein